MNLSFATSALTGMSLLTIWGLSSLIYGRKLQREQNNASYFFGRMTFFWGIINTLLGVGAFITVVRNFNEYDVITKRIEAQNIYSFNTKLDLLYILIGSIVILLGKKNSNLCKGYGLAIIAQGLFLFGLDLILALI